MYVVAARARRSYFTSGNINIARILIARYHYPRRISTSLGATHNISSKYIIIPLIILISRAPWARAAVRVHKLNQQRQNPRNLSRRNWHLIRNTFVRGGANARRFTFKVPSRGNVPASCKLYRFEISARAKLLSRSERPPPPAPVRRDCG